MSRIAYVSGQYKPYRAANVPIDDRGYQFADGVYEVVAVAGGCLIDEIHHLHRLGRSLSGLRIEWPVSELVLPHIMRRIVRLNRVMNGSLYMQITRGVAKRMHEFPLNARPQLVITAKKSRPTTPEMLLNGVTVITVPDQRWTRRDLKTISLLPNVLGKQEARDRGAYEAWQVEANGTVTEGTSSNAWIVTSTGEIKSHPATPQILNGITRLVLIEAAAELGLTLVERPFNVAEAQAASEAFLSSTTSLVVPVTEIDGVKIGGGRPGPIVAALRKALEKKIAQQIRKVGS